MRTNRYLLSVFALAFMAGACMHEDKGPQNATNESRIVNLPKGNTVFPIKTTALKIGSFEYVITCQGSVIPATDQVVIIPAPMKGFLKKKLASVGDFVEIGAPLAILEHPNYVDLQKNYIQTKSQYEYLNAEYKRQGELSVEDAASLKTMQKAKNEFETVEAQYYALQKQIEYLGIDAEKISYDNLLLQITIFAPISGTITNSLVIPGELCTEETTIFKIVNGKNCSLKILMDEKYKNVYSTTQKIEFAMSGNPHKKFIAELQLPSQNIYTDGKTMLTAKILSSGTNALPGMEILAYFPVTADSVYSLPSSAIFVRESKQYVFSKISSGTYQPKEVNTGNSWGGKTEILLPDSSLLNSEIVYDGVGNILMH